MSKASVSLDPAGVLYLKGVLDHNSGPLLRVQGQALIRDSASKILQVNCAGVEKSSSVGLALLLAFMRDGQQYGKSIELVQLPEDMRKIAQVCDLTEILGIESSEIENSKD